MPEMKLPRENKAFSRAFPVFVSLTLFLSAGGLAAAIIAESGEAFFLGAVGAFVAALPAVLVLFVWIEAGFTGLGWDKAKERFLGSIKDRAPERSPLPVVLVVQTSIVALVVWQVALFASKSFKRVDLSALVVGAAAAIAFLAAAAVSALVKSPLSKLAAKVSASNRSWLPLASVFSTSAWCFALIAAAASAAAASMWRDLVAADLTVPLAVAGLNLGVAVVFFALFLALPNLLSGKARQGTFPALILMSALILVAGAVPMTRDNAALAAVNQIPGIGIGIEAGRKLTDFDGDGFSSFLSGGDCAPFDSSIYPGAREIPDNGVDDNCSGSDSKGGSFDKPAPRFADPSTLCPRGDCNVVFITIDSFRTDQLTLYGSKEAIMPNLEQLARDSVVFDNAYTPGTGTILTVPCMLAGVFDSELKMDRRIKGPLPVHGDVDLISEDLSKAGVATLAVLEHYYLDPINQGWTEFYNPYSPTFYRETSVERQTDKIVEFLRKYKNRPFFLYAHLNEPHHDYLLHEGFDKWGDDLLGRYRSELVFTDHHLKKVFDTVKNELSERPTMIIVSADHGEGLGQHRIKYHNGGFYRELARVPLIVHHPAVSRRKLEEPVSLLDIAPTLRNLFGLDPYPKHVGTSLLGQILKGDELKNRTIYHQALYDQGGRYYNMVGITNKRYSLIHDMRRQTYEMFDIERDPHETKNLADESNPKFIELRKKMDDWLEAIGLDASFVHRDWEEAPPGARRPKKGK
jgi:choline-sulfatase